LLHRIPLGAWFLVGALVVAGVQAVYLSRCDWNPTAFLQVGTGSPARGQIERDFPELWLEPTLGHDGKYSYLVARAPAFWKADAETLANLQDPAYRYARPLDPLLAGVGGQLSPRCTLAGLILVQILAGGLGAVALAAFARSQRLPVVFVAVNIANPGIAGSACLLTCDALAHAISVLAWYYAETRRVCVAIGLFALALATKEYYVLTPLALAAALAAHGHWRRASALAILPPIPIFCWKLVLFAAFGPGEGQGNFTWPGGGMLASATLWTTRYAPVGLLGIALVAGALVAASAPRLPARLRLACAVWGLLGLCLSELVWNDPNDLLRAIGPAWWFVSWAAFRIALRSSPSPSPFASASPRSGSALPLNSIGA